MPCLLVLTKSADLAVRIHAIGDAAGWRVLIGESASLNDARGATRNTDAALIDLISPPRAPELLLRDVAKATPFLPLVLLGGENLPIAEGGTGLHYHLDAEQLDDLEHILISLSCGFVLNDSVRDRQSNDDSVPRVLVVDDNVQLAGLISRSLRSLEKYDVQETHTGYEAASLLPHFRPDVVVIDLVLRDMEAAELCRLIRGHDQLKNTRILGLAGYSHKEFGEDDEPGLDGFVRKPFRMKDILDKVVELLPASTSA
jgi:CheY-like chemotaxis protein